MEAKERLWLTRERDRIVSEDSGEAAFLAYAEGDEITPEDAKQFNIRDGKAPTKR